MKIPHPDKSSKTFGGSTKEYYQPTIRAFDRMRRKRKVKAYVTTWKGISIGAKHYYARLEEEDNPAFVIKDDGYLTWMLASDDEEGRGRKFNLDCLTIQEAEQWIVNKFETEFGYKTHKIVDRLGEKWKPRNLTKGDKKK